MLILALQCNAVVKCPALISNTNAFGCLQDEEEEEAEPAKPVKAERPSSRDYANAQKKTNLRSEDQTFKVQEEQRYSLCNLCYAHDNCCGVPCASCSHEFQRNVS